MLTADNRADTVEPLNCSMCRCEEDLSRPEPSLNTLNVFRNFIKRVCSICIQRKLLYHREALPRGDDDVDADGAGDSGARVKGERHRGRQSGTFENRGAAGGNDVSVLSLSSLVTMGATAAQALFSYLFLGGRAGSVGASSSYDPFKRNRLTGWGCVVQVEFIPPSSHWLEARGLFNP